MAQEITWQEFPAFVTKLGSSYSMFDFNTKLNTLGLGLGGEGGEIANILVECNLRPTEFPEELRLKLVDELSDILWYVAFGCANVVECDFYKTFEEMEPGLAFCPALTFRENYPILMAACGGVTDVVKKVLFHGKPYNEAVRNDLIKKIGNIMKAVTFIGKEVCGVTVKEIIEHNIKKLSERYKSLSFSTEEFMAKENAKQE